MRRPAVGRASVPSWISPPPLSAACPGDAPVVQPAFVAGAPLSPTVFPRTAPSAATTSSSALPPSTSPASLHPSNGSLACPPTAASPVATSSSRSGPSGKLRTTNSASPAKHISGAAAPRPLSRRDRRRTTAKHGSAASAGQALLLGPFLLYSRDKFRSATL